MLWLLSLLTMLPAPQQAPPLSRAWVVRAEKGVHLDRLLFAERNQGRPRPLKDHVRYYQREKRQGRDIVHAVYEVADVQHGPGIYIEPLPHVFDGGCWVVDLTFDYRTRRVLTAYCNGRG